MTTPAMTGKDRAMPNNSDQAALHDELRAQHVAALAALAGNSVFFPHEKGALNAAIAALSMPASEAVAMWPISEEQYQEALTAYEDAYEITDSHCNGIAAVIKTLLKWRDDPATTPPPAPAAHAGGEAIPVDALRELATQLASDAECKGLSAGYRSACGHIHNQLTALLSGGAAREGAPDLMALHDETMRQLRGETK